MIPPKTRLNAEAVHDQRTALVRDMVEKESAALDAKTARLKALRLAKEAEEPPAPAAAKGRKKKAP